MRLLITSPSALGHVNPIVPLALAAIEAGHDVRWATGADACAYLERFGIPTATAGLTTPDRIAIYERRYPESASIPGEERPEFMFPRLFGAVAATAMIDELLAVVEDWPPDLVVHDAAEFAGLAVAVAAGIPHAVHSFGDAVPPRRVQAAIEQAAAVWDRVGVTPAPFGGCFDHLYIDVYPPSLHPPGSLDHVGRRVGRRPVSGDAAPSDALTERVAALVADDRRLAYLTFGTIFNVNDTFARAVRGLAAEELDLSVVVTVGPNGDVDAFGSLPDRVVVEQYVPQSLLLPHLDLVASHAGSGTALATLAQGVPQLCLPQAADQFRNSAAIVAAGAGLSLLGSAATEDAITAAVARLLTEPEHRAGAQRMAAEIAAMPEPAAVVDELEALVAD
jgi:UDP:flavonoid glycosyltransferase YjiC (YdhE family)